MGRWPDSTWGKIIMALLLGGTTLWLAGGVFGQPWEPYLTVASVGANLLAIGIMIALGLR